MSHPPAFIRYYHDEARRTDVTMSDDNWLAEQFEAHRARLRSVGYRMLGSLSEADDAVQEAWLRLTRAGASGVENLGGWLTTVVARVCLDLLRSRSARREEPLNVHLPDPIVSPEDENRPDHEALLADSVGLALIVVLETLAPAERLAFVLHDMFAMPFEEIAPLVGRSSAAARQLASRARRRVRGAAKPSDADVGGQRKVVDAFLTAARGGDLKALLAVLDPDVVVRADHGAVASGASGELRGARVVAEQALAFSSFVQRAQPVRVNGCAGIVGWLPNGQPFSVMAFTISRGKIAEINVLADPVRLRRLNLTAVGDQTHSHGPENGSKRSD